MLTPARMEIPASFSRIPAKRQHYANDTYFREGYEDAQAVAAAQLDRLCHDHTLLLLKPDAVVSRQLVPAIRWLNAKGAAIVGAELVSFDRHTIRALWQYGLNAASRDRRDAADMYMAVGKSLLLILAWPDRLQPASLALATLKGPAEPARCRPTHLRHYLRSRNYQLNMVHAPDEPADFLRDLAVLLDSPTRLRILNEALLGHDAAGMAYALAATLESETTAEELDLAVVVSQIAHRAATSEHARASALSRLLQEIQTGASRDWRSTIHRATQLDIEVTQWQRIVLSTSLVEPFVAGRESLLPDLA